MIRARGLAGSPGEESRNPVTGRAVGVFGLIWLPGPDEEEHYVFAVAL